MIRSMVRRASGGRWPQIRPGEKMACPEVGRLLQQFLDEELDDPNAVAALAAHHRPTVPAESVQRLREFGERLVEEG